jgi:FMN phosphatase YigB (HAD superfamily)
MSSPAARLIPASSRTLLLTFDAFGTLFHPRLPVPEQYAATAHQFGLSRTAVTPDKLATAFKDTFRAQMRQYPNYGRADVLRGQYGGPRQWWEEVIRGSFGRVLSTENGETRPETPKVHIPDGMVEALLDRFAGAEGYALYDDVLPFFRRMHKLKSANKWSFDRIIVGVVSNSDDRVPVVLKSLGLTVGDMRADQDQSSMDLPGFEVRGMKKDVAGEHGKDYADGNLDLDIDMVITSYEAGEEKPHRLIFDVARRQALKVARPWLTSRTKFKSVHVGDDFKKDYQGASDAGWESYLLPRDSHGAEGSEAKQFPDLLGLADKLDLFP